ncbi:DNA alkylation repair protein [Sphingobacterium olei]|uniref:DNA alkylation repair protein n=1 Tax=Sphingobacterium olei TaxID=2571155 RepID=A0A4U0NY76_9SPHI|nr:DNA alkylation repair protein [Sphingobacterium olei]TJZ59816.1 DNA alkylation repair protein [Sphingobacterium olei]
MEPLKEMFNREFYVNFAHVFGEVTKDFHVDSFLGDVTRDMDTLSLNGRLRNTSHVLKKYLPTDYKRAVAILYEAAPSLPSGYTALVLPDYVALYGKQHFDLSMEALQYFTRYGSAEFAIREFLKTDLVKTLDVMHKWAEDSNDHVRRLASEGSRPRLPWSFKLTEIIKQPMLTQGILERLNADEALYVRKSVANHLNDHTKDNDSYMLKLVSSWDKANKHTSWIIKHAIRSLIKRGNKEALMIFGFENEVSVKLDNLTTDRTSLQLGDSLHFSFGLSSESEQEQKLVVDYAIHYVKVSGSRTKKVFKLREVKILPGQTIQFSKKQQFQDLTTRKHYAGEHQLEILVNGKVKGSIGFEII